MLPFDHPRFRDHRIISRQREPFSIPGRLRGGHHNCLGKRVKLSGRSPEDALAEGPDDHQAESEPCWPQATSRRSSDLFLLDAEQALHEGRFREAVLFCWSTIDSTFNRKYDELVDAKLAEEWAEAREFFKGVDFGLKKKMSAALYLVSGRSLFRESGDLWEQLSVSYNKRNGIIHRGESATEDDARRALDVARRVVEIMSTLVTAVRSDVLSWGVEQLKCRPSCCSSRSH